MGTNILTTDEPILKLKEHNTIILTVLSNWRRKAEAKNVQQFLKYLFLRKGK
jgi:hypothetical protein